METDIKLDPEKMNEAQKEYYKKVLSTSALDVGKYGSMRLHHLREFKPGLYAQMIMSQTLIEHCSELDECIQEMINKERRKFEHLKDQTLVYVNRCRELEDFFLREMVFTE